MLVPNVYPGSITPAPRLTHHARPVGGSRCCQLAELGERDGARQKDGDNGSGGEGSLEQLVPGGREQGGGKQGGRVRGQDWAGKAG